jgi:hypothetical protein
VARKPNKTVRNTGFGDEESRNKSRNDSAVRESFYIDNAVRGRCLRVKKIVTLRGESVAACSLNNIPAEGEGALSP